MFDWIPFLAGILILTWAFFAGYIALRGGAHAGLHDVAPPPPAEEPPSEAMTVARTRIVPFPVIQALQFVAAAVVSLAGIWLLIQAVD
jgi:hypothetical protein